MQKQAAVIILLVVVILSAVQSCSKDKTNTPDVLVCDSTATYTYLNDVKPIYDVHCATIGCHSSIVKAAGINLDDYTSAKQFTENSKVICVMKHTCAPVMPQGAPKLADSLIRVIECWKKNGYQN